MHLQINFSYNDYFRVPGIQIGIDDIVLFNGPVCLHVEFEPKLVKGTHTFWITHHSKQPHETTNEHDTHVFIKNILFDGVDIDQLEYQKLSHRGKFYPEYNTDYVKDCIMNNIELPEYFSPNHYLGHNGIWKLDFEAPAMNWIIKEQNPSGINLEDTMFSTGKNTIQEIKDLFNL